MYVSVYVDPQVALKRGSCEAGGRAVRVTPELVAMLGEEERAEMPVHADDRYYSSSRVTADGYTPEDIVAAVRGPIARRAAEAAEREARVEKWLATPTDEPDVWLWGDGSRRSCVPDDPRLADHLSRAKAVWESRFAATKAAAEAARAAKIRESAEEKAKADAEKARAEAALLEWAQAHGSELLRARIEEGYEWHGLARQEYADSCLASVTLQRAPTEGSAADRSTPTMAEIVALRQLRATLPAGCSAELRWVTYGPADEDEDEHEEAESVSESRAEIRVQVTCPDRGQVVRWFVAPTE